MSRRDVIADITVDAESIRNLRRQAEHLRKRADEIDQLADELKDFSTEIRLSAETR